MRCFTCISGSFGYSIGKTVTACLFGAGSYFVFDADNIKYVTSCSRTVVYSWHLTYSLCFNNIKKPSRHAVGGFGLSFCNYCCFDIPKPKAYECMIAICAFEHRYVINQYCQIYDYKSIVSVGFKFMNSIP
jgi:hypothetical protein